MVDYFFPYSCVGLSQETISRYCPFNSEWRKAFFLILLRRDPPSPPHHLVTFWHETIQSYNFSTEKGLYITVVSSYIHHMQGWNYKIVNSEQTKKTFAAVQYCRYEVFQGCVYCIYIFYLLEESPFCSVYRVNVVWVSKMEPYYFFMVNRLSKRKKHTPN